MQRRVLNSCTLGLAQKMKIVPGGVKWVSGQEVNGRISNFRTLAIGNNSAALTALNPLKSFDSKSSTTADKSLSFGAENTSTDSLKTPRNSDVQKIDIRKNRLSNNTTPFDYKVHHETDVNAILELSLSSELTLRGASMIISRLGELAQTEKLNMSINELQRDDRFKTICKLLQEGNHSQVPQSLLQAIRGLRYLKFPYDGLVQELENELKWSLRRCPVKYLARSIETLSQDRASESETTKADNNTSGTNASYANGIQQDPLVVAVQTLQRRWAEVFTGLDFVSVFKIFNLLDGDTREKLEDRAAELVQDFSSQEIVKMFCALAKQKRRPTPLLRALAFHLSKSSEKIPTKELVELIYALNELTFADPVLMQRLCNELHLEIESVKYSPWISSIVTSLGQMRYMHKELMGAIEEWISKHLDELRPFDCASWLLASSVFHLNSAKQKEFIEKAKSKLTQETVSTPIEWLNIVHALVVLDEATTDLVSSVLKPEFVKNIDSMDENNASARLKLLNVNAVVKPENKAHSVQLSGYNGPQLTKEFIKKWAETSAESDSYVFKSVIDSLSNFLPPPKYMRAGVKTESGVFVDAMCLLNEKTDPVPVDSPNSKGAMKVAIVVQGYTALCLGTKVPTGSSALNVRLLEGEGYHVILVPYTEYSPKEKILRRVQYLEQKVRNVNSSMKKINEVGNSPSSLDKR